MGKRPLVTLRLPFRLGFATKKVAVGATPAGNTAGHLALEERGDPVAAAARAAEGTGAAGPPALTGSPPTAVDVATLYPPLMPARVLLPPVTVATPEPTDAGDASASLVWLAYTSSLAARAATLEDATLAALEGHLDPAPRRRAARDTYKLVTSLWLVEARNAARQAWEAAGLLDAGTLLGTASALRLSQIVESLHKALRALDDRQH